MCYFKYCAKCVRLCHIERPKYYKFAQYFDICTICIEQLKLVVLLTSTGIQQLQYRCVDIYIYIHESIQINLSFIMRRFWSEFEKFNNCKYPKIIKDILKLCAIDQGTLVDITEETIEQIEKIVNKNKNILKKSCYASFVDKSEEFKLLFGHRLSLLNIPEKYKLFIRDKTEKKKARKEETLKLKNATSDESDDETEANNPGQLKNNLIKHLNNYAGNENNYTITEREVKNVRIRGEELYCCPVSIL